jgi:ribosomal protein S12 methylthiotransferase
VNDFEGSSPRAGEIRRLRITETHDYDVVGSLARERESSPASVSQPFPILTATR